MKRVSVSRLLRVLACLALAVTISPAMMNVASAQSATPKPRPKPSPKHTAKPKPKPLPSPSPSPAPTAAPTVANVQFSCSFPPLHVVLNSNGGGIQLIEKDNVALNTGDANVSKRMTHTRGTLIPQAQETKL